MGPLHYVTVCSSCGSLNVQVTAWVFANRDANVDTGSDAPSDDAWCERCNDHVCTYTLERDAGGLFRWDQPNNFVLPLREAIRAVRHCGLNRRKAVRK